MTILLPLPPLRRTAAGALALVLLSGAPAAAAGTGGWSAELLPAPTFPDAPQKLSLRGPGPQLEPVSSKPNEIIDETAWFTANKLPHPERDLKTLPESIPRRFRDASLLRAFDGGDRLFLVFGQDFGDQRYLMAADPRSYAFQYGYDFQRWEHPPDEIGEFTGQRVIWAVEKDGILYVSNGHNTYARESKGRNAYVTAIDPKKDEILWRSPALVANARTFLLLDDLILTGYGFTAEPDFLYLLDRKTGEIRARQPLETGPDFILLQGDQIFVRCYDTDEVFRLRR